MKPIGEYPSPAEYRAVAVSPRIPPRRDESDATPTLASDSGLENPTTEKHHVEYLATAPAAPVPSPDVETPVDESTPALSTTDDVIKTYNQENFREPRAVLRSLPMPTYPGYDTQKLFKLISLSVVHACKNGTPASVKSLCYLWYRASKEIMYALFIDNLGRSEKDRDINYTLALQCVLRDEEEEAEIWYDNYVRDELPLFESANLAEQAHDLKVSTVSPFIGVPPFAQTSEMLQVSQEPQMAQGSDSFLSSTNPWSQVKPFMLPQAPATLENPFTLDRAHASQGNPYVFGLPSILPNRLADFKPSNIYRDTSGARLEELFMNGKSNTAPLKRPKKACPVDQIAYQRKRQWEGDPDHDEKMREKRVRFAEQQSSLADYPIPESAMRDTIGLGPEAPREGFPFETFERRRTRGGPKLIERAQTVPPEGEILGREIGMGWVPVEARPAQSAAPTPSIFIPFEGEILDPEIGMDVVPDEAPTAQSAAPTPSIVAPEVDESEIGASETDEPVVVATKSAKKKGKSKQKPAKRERSLSVDTTISSLSSLSNSCYSVRFNDWGASHPPRQMPNSMYVFCVTSICYLCSVLLTWPLTVNPPRTATTVKNVEREATWFAATPAPTPITSSAWILPWIPTIRRREIGIAPSARSATASPL